MKYAIGFGEWVSESTGNEKLDMYGITLGDLFFGKKEKKDYIRMMNKTTPAGRDVLVDLRKEAGDRLTAANISTRMATQLLVNVGYIAYQNGCRDVYANYAASKVKGRTFGCLKYVLAIISLVIIYFIFH